ncbi:D-alanyl-D-alanine carboxypeptidase, partial [Candidatus Uhrbacteria bacterium]|nr:D-alanyl-D-alanine carboxypeptidase [Candidatus Uhrbacteria bacterium]
VGGKTGFIDESGYNLAVEVKNEDKQVMAVVLGSKTSDDRFREVKNLVHWAFENYDWSTVKLSGL